MECIAYSGATTTQGQKCYLFFFFGVLAGKGVLTGILWKNRGKRCKDNEPTVKRDYNTHCQFAYNGWSKSLCAPDDYNTDSIIITKHVFLASLLGSI
jgi:hypothetical protein